MARYKYIDTHPKLIPVDLSCRMLPVTLARVFAAVLSVCDQQRLIRRAMVRSTA